MTPGIESGSSNRMSPWPATPLGYPVASVVVRGARNLGDRVTTGRDEDGAAR
jgi:hypothetical protein